jgi:hypothetical protein
METLIYAGELMNRGRRRGLWLIFLRQCFSGIKTPTVSGLNGSVRLL